MSIKNLFGKTITSYEDVAKDVESTDFIDEVVAKRETYLPPIDFSDPANFVFYGSAELYYEAAIKRIHEDYPYDGSKAEQIEFEEKSSFLERWLFENKYPKTTGHVELGTTGMPTTLSGVYRGTSVNEYIRVWGGLHISSESSALDYQLSNSAVYDEANNRTQNFNCDFENGVTVEFWMKKDSTTLNEAEVILDLWNGSSTSTNSRMIIEFIDFSNPYIRLSLQKDALIEQKLIDISSHYSDSTWMHFAFSLIKEDSVLQLRVYVNGVIISTPIPFSNTFEFDGKMDAFLGALQTSIGGFGTTGSGKFQGYLDEFRFWKTKRTSRQIKLNWFREIGGGANTDDNTSDLGVYLKFNEGITGNTSIDSTVLDYSGRLANGTWIGYPGSSARSTDSAMEAAGYTEAPTPIIYSNHPDVVSLEAEMTLSGSDYDEGRGQAFYRSLPNWLVEEDMHEGEENLRKISHILSSYMDTLKVQIDSLSRLQDKQYVAAKYKATPFASELLKNKGFITSEMFLSSEVFETFSSIDYDSGQFDLNIDEIKNLIFTNIYNNLENIYNTKGTEKSIRNLIRCFGIDDELIKLNQYTDGGTQYLADKYRSTSVKKKYVNLNNPAHFESTMYQSGSLTFISGALEASVGAFTLEADILVPYKKKLGDNGFFATPFLSASVMGFHEANPTDASDFTWSSDGAAEARDLQVYLVRDSNLSDHAKFVLKNQSETIYVTSSYIDNIYNNEHYNVALRIKPQTYPYAGNVTNTTPNYDIELYAVSHNFDELKEEVLLSAVVDNATGSAYLQRPKRVYAGSHHQNFTGSYLHRTDLQFGRVSAWLDYLPNSSIKEHNKDVLNYGNNKSIDGSNAFAITDVQIPSMELSILNWDFDTVTTSTATGEFVIEDTTSGSSDTIYGWVDNIIRREHDGKGEFFPTESTSFLENEFLYANKKQLPETSFNTNNIFIKGDEEINFGEDDDVSDNLFVLEKSPSAIVSEEMLKLFSTTQEFSNLFGRHVDRYRVEYKDLAKARQLFYQRVDTGIDFDKFFGYFKWIDQSISEMINQLVPASVNFAGGVIDVIEPHILERDKYQRQVGLLQTVTSTEASIRGVQEMNYNWRIGHAPIPLDDTTNSLWQKERSERDTTERQAIVEVLTTQVQTGSFERSFLSGSDGVYEGRAYATRRFSRPVRAKVEFRDSIHGGTNYEKAKDRDFLRSAIGLHSSLGASGAPKNIVTFGAGPDYGLNYEETLKTKDAMSPSEKINIPGFGVIGKFTEFSGDYDPISPDAEYLSRRKMSHVFIGNIVSGSVTTGYNSKINNSVAGGGYRSGVNLVNLHSDTTDITNEVPIQGPFTERWIGGHQHRHVALNSVGKPERFTPSYTTNGLDHEFSRPEGWRLLVGKNPLVNTGSINDIDADDDGAIGFTAPDYGIGQDGSWPDEDRLYAIYYREERAKRPLNIKNIQTTTSSVYHGNYQHEYEVMSTFGDQGYFLRRAGNLLPDAISQALPETTNYHTLIAQTSSVSGNYFGEGNNRQYDTETILLSPAAASFIMHQAGGALAPSALLGQRIEIARAVGPTITFSITSNASFVSGDLDGSGYTVVSTNGKTWPDMIAEFETAFEHPTNGFGGDVIVVGSYNAAGANGEEVAIFIVEDNLVGTSGNGGILLNSTPTPADVYFDAITSGFEGGIDSSTTLGNVTETQDRSTGSAHVIRTRFSAPGGPEINSSGYLDVATQQYSVHNSINFRNLTTRGDGSGEEGKIRVNSHANRREGLRTLRTRHQGQFGIDSQHGVVRSEDYIAEASFHKQHRNTRKVAKLGDFTNPTWTTETSGTVNRYDNASINTPIPASDFQYSWVNSAISGSNWEDNQIILTYAPKNGIISSSSGIDSAINFPGSDVECFPCFEPEVLATSLGYLKYATSTVPIESSTSITLAAMLDNTGIPGIIIDGVSYSTVDDSKLNDITFASTYSGCCDSGDLTYAIAVDGDTPSYASGTPVVPTIYFNQDCRVSMRYYIKQCTGKVDSITLNILNASATQPVATTTAFVELDGNPNATYNSDFNIYMFASTELSTDVIGADSIDRIDLSVLLENFCCPDFTYAYRYRTAPLVPADSYIDIGSSTLSFSPLVISHTDGTSSTSVGTIGHTPGTTTYFQVRVTDCNENTDTILITINNATIS